MSHGMSQDAPRLTAWTLTEPTSAGHRLILDDQGYCLATAKAADVAKLLWRAQAMRSLLELLHYKLSTDDDGTRWEAEIKLIGLELALSGGMSQPPPPAPPPPAVDKQPPRPSLEHRINAILQRGGGTEPR